MNEIFTIQATDSRPGQLPDRGETRQAAGPRCRASIAARQAAPSGVMATPSSRVKLDA